MSATRLILLGPAGAGKGTQSERLVRDLGIPQVSTGDLLRAARAAGTELGDKAKSYMDKGELVPDELVFQLVEDRLAQADAQNGYILDGFPRNLAQAVGLSARNVVVERVVNLKVPSALLLPRLTGRRICRLCKTSFHIDFRPTKVDGVCDLCGGETYQRKDDQPEAIEKRLSVYASDTAPLVGFYGEAVREVDGVGGMDTVYARILEALQ